MVLNLREKIVLIVLGLFLLIDVGLGLYSVQITREINAKLAQTKIVPVIDVLPSPTPVPIKIINYEKSIVFLNDKLVDSDVVLKVGEENIYYKDFTIETGAMTVGRDTTHEIQIEALKKLASDSVILQYCQSKKYVPFLPDTIYNSPLKQYPLRLESLLVCENQIAINEFAKINGDGMAIYFYNIASRDMSIEEARDFVKNKIMAAYDKAQSEKLTVEVAMSALKNDPDFTKFPNLKYNVVPYAFDAPAATRITGSQNFDKMIWETPKGGLTPLYRTVDIQKDADGKVADDVYMFASIKEKSPTGYLSIADFSEKNMNLYDIVVY